MVLIIVAIAVVVVLAVVFLVTTARRDRAAATGSLSRETMRRDRSRTNPVLDDTAASEGQPATGRAVERA